MNISAKHIIEKYGYDVNVTNTIDNTTKSIKAFIQPFRPNSETYLLDTDNNTNDDGVYLYIGHPSLRLDLYPIGTKISSGGNTYILKKADSIIISDNVVYIRGILHKISN